MGPRILLLVITPRGMLRHACLGKKKHLVAFASGLPFSRGCVAYRGFALQCADQNLGAASYWSETARQSLIFLNPPGGCVKGRLTARWFGPKRKPSMPSGSNGTATMQRVDRRYNDAGTNASGKKCACACWGTADTSCEQGKHLSLVCESYLVLYEPLGP